MLFGYLSVNETWCRWTPYFLPENVQNDLHCFVLRLHIIKTNHKQFEIFFKNKYLPLKNVISNCRNNCIVCIMLIVNITRSLDTSPLYFQFLKNIAYYSYHKIQFKIKDKSFLHSKSKRVKFGVFYIITGKIEKLPTRMNIS